MARGRGDADPSEGSAGDQAYLAWISSEMFWGTGS